MKIESQQDQSKYSQFSNYQYQSYVQPFQQSFWRIRSGFLHLFLLINEWHNFYFCAILINFFWLGQLQFELLLQMNDENLFINANAPMVFDQKPIGNKLKFDIPEYAENEGSMIPEVVVVQKLPLLKRLQSVALKTKRQALQELSQLVKDNPKEYKQYEELTIELVSYTHALVVDKILKIVILYLHQQNQLNVDQKTFIKALIEKCLASDKADKQEIKKSCEQILFWFMDNKCEEMLLNELNDQLLNKNPKIVGTSLLFLANLLNNYGIKRMKGMQKFYKHLQFMSSPAKPTAKPQTIQLFKQIYRWMGENLFREFKMHIEVKEELVKFSKQYQIVPLEIKRGVKRQVQGEAKVLYKMDAEESDNQDEVDVLGTFTSKWVDDVLEISKWKDKKAELDQFIKKTRINSILAPREVGHFITLIKRLLADNNINLLLCGFSISQNLSKGLKRNFSNVAKNISPYIFSKLKDAKPNIVQAAQQTLRSLLYSVGLDELLQEVKVSLDDKAPQMRLQVLKFLNNFSNKKQAKILNIMRSLLDKLVKLTEDGSQVVRKQALELLCNLKKSHDMKFFGDRLKNMDSKKISAIMLSKSNQMQEAMDIQPSAPNQSYVPPQVYKKEQPKMQIQQKQQVKEIKEVEKPSKQNASIKLKQEDPSVNSSVQTKPLKTVSSKTLSDLFSPNESVRYVAYQQILARTSHQDLKPLMFQIKSNTIRESGPNNLKLVLQIARKYSGAEPIDMQTLDYIYKHDWRKAKISLQDFLSNNKFTPQASDYIRHNSSVAVSSSKASYTPISTLQPGTTLKSFMKELEYLITKMTNPIPQMRIQAAEHAIKFLEALPPVQNENELVPTNGWNQQCINKFCGLVRYRLNEGEGAARIYSDLLKLMINKGLLTKNKGLKVFMQTIVTKLKERKPYIKQIFQEIARCSPQFIFSVIHAEIVKEVNEPLIEFIIENNELFIRNAELKNFICPFLNLIFDSDMNIHLKTELEKILDQIVQLNGQNVLQAEIKKVKVNNIEPFLLKYNINIVSQPSYSQKSIHLKADRLKMDDENPWPIFATPNHILKLINQLISLKEPLPTLATPLPLTDQILETISELQLSFLAQYSDLLLKWTYWRSVIDPPEAIPYLLKLAYNICFAVQANFVESQFTVLLGSMINMMDRFKGQHLQAIGQVLRALFQLDYSGREKSLLFWINLITKQQNSKKVPVNEILILLTVCYSTQALTTHLPTLARCPEVVKNQHFLRFLSSNFDHQFLTVSGFRVIGFQRQNKQGELKPLLSEMGGPENTIPISHQQKRVFVSMFQKYSSLQLENQIKSINKNCEPSVLIDTHMKIIYSVVVPFMKKEIPIINVFTYFRELARLFNCAEVLKYSHCLKDLTRMLMYFLIDLDQNTIENKQEITKTVNRIILFVLERADSKHMLQVLVLLLRYQLDLNANIKIQHLIYKCIGKVTKFSKFGHEHLQYIIGETNSLFSTFDIKMDHPLVKTIRNIWKGDLLSMNFAPYVEEIIKNMDLNPNLRQIYREANSTESMPIQKEKQAKSTEVSSIKGMTCTAINKFISVKKGQQQP